MHLRAEIAAFMAAIVTALFIATPAGAQMTAGDLKARGVRMTKSDLEALLKGATMRYTSIGGQPYQYSFNADGTFQGTTTTRQGRPSRMGHHGTWTVTDEGRFCRTDDAKGQAGPLCWQLWHADGKYYYIGQGDSVRELEFSR